MSLSEKIIDFGVGRFETETQLLAVIHVREAVKELKSRKSNVHNCTCCESWISDIDEIFGEKLI